MLIVIRWSILFLLQAIPSTKQVTEWMSHTPPSFLFHFKVFGLFTRLTADLATLPGSVRGLAKATAGVVHLRAQSPEFKSALWAAQNRVLELLHSNGRLGNVVFQFAEKLDPTDRSREHIAWCRQQLFAPALMAVELRNMAWTKDEAEIQRTVEFMRGIPAVLIATDNLEGELLNEFVPKARVPLPIHLRLSCADAVYVRIHRRQGSARVLSDAEIDAWVARLHQLRDSTDVSSSPLKGPIFWMIGTDHEDQPVINARKMQAALEVEDQRRRQLYEAKMQAASTEAASSSAAAAASSSSSSAASSSAHPADSACRSPEPLAFDYRSYYHRHLARLSSSVIGACDSSHQTSLGAFFGRASAAEAQQRMIEQEEMQQAEDAEGNRTEEKKLQGSMMQFVSVARPDSAAAAAAGSVAPAAVVPSTTPAASRAAASSPVAAPIPAAPSLASPATFADDSSEELEVLSSHVVTSPSRPTAAAAVSASPAAAAVGSKKKAPSSHASLHSPTASPAKKSKKQANDAAAAAAAAANTKPIASFFKKG